nr:MAG TPA: hypothetical protein [Caudoviricetes sp.]
MAIVKQYPHYLFRKVTTGATQDENGDYVAGVEKWEFVSMCREETNGKGSVVTLADGRAITFGALVQCPKGSSRIPEGTIIRVSDDDQGASVRCTGECLKSDCGQLHTRHWL